MCIIKASTDIKLFKKEELQLSNYLSDYMDVFSEIAVGILLKHTEYNYAIELEPGTISLYKSIYRLMETEYEILKNYLNKIQEKDWIKLFKNPVGASILFVLKKDDKF